MLFLGKPVQQRGCVLQSTGLINDLFDVHGNRHALGDAPHKAQQGATSQQKCAPKATIRGR